MQVLAAAAVALLIGASTVVAVRLLMLHKRTGAGPELLLGWMLLLSVGVAYPLRIAADRGSPEWSGACLAVSAIAIGVGFSLLFVFTWRVFRPQAIWARVFAAAGVITVLGKALHGCVRVYRLGAIDVMDEPSAEILLQTAPLLVAYLWTACESLRYYGMMRRRVKLGLADVAVTDRFLLWGGMALSATGGVSVNTFAILLHMDALNSPPVLLVSSTFGLAQTVFLVLAFLPPRFYLNWIRARGAAPGA